MAEQSRISDVPYVKQSDSPGDRTCGAACLSMVYRAFGKEVQESAIWPQIAKPNKFGILSSTTHLMVREALQRGYAAIAIQTRYPLQSLRMCHESGIRAILNHRLRADVSVGHYAVLVEIDDQNVVLHDPLYGPLRRLPHAELLQLWQPSSSNSEIAGNVLIGIAKPPNAVTGCALCQALIPTHVECPNCTEPVSLQPAPLLGCISTTCLGRLWHYLCCPACDHMWSFDISEEERAQGPGIHIRQPNLPSAQGPIDLVPLFAEMDKFCDHIRAIPGAADHARIRQQIDFIQASKGKLKLAQAEQFAFRQMRQDQLAKLVETAKQKKEAHVKRMQELNTPSPPLDGNALGRALLKNLGFTR